MAEQAPDEKHQSAVAAPAPEAEPVCGIIMPISDTPGYDPGHWLEVRKLIARAARAAGYTARMVSDNDGQDAIQRSIVKNIYHNELVICDVSSRNPNVMLELGLRMANKKPLIIIFDGEGSYPFDINIMLRVNYPKGLRHARAEEFVQELTERIIQVTEAANAGKYEPLLSHFNDVVIEESRLGTTTKGLEETLISLAEEFKGMKAEIKLISSDRDNSNRVNDNSTTSVLTVLEVGYINHITKITYAVIDNRKLSFTNLVEHVYNECIRLASQPYGGYTDPKMRTRLIQFSGTAKDIISEELINLSGIGSRSA
jgi:hypothetical protein